MYEYASTKHGNTPHTSKPFWVALTTLLLTYHYSYLLHLSIEQQRSLSRITAVVCFAPPP